MSEPSVRPTLSGVEFQRRSESAAAQLATSVLRLNRAANSADSFTVGGEPGLVPAVIPLEMSRQELEDLVTLRRALTADFAELLLENFEVELEGGLVEVGDVPLEYEVELLPASEPPPPETLERMIRERPLLEEG